MLAKGSTAIDGRSAGSGDGDLSRGLLEDHQSLDEAVARLGAA